MSEEFELDSKIGAQLSATQEIVKALSPLDIEARSMVITHACQLLGVVLGAPAQPFLLQAPTGVVPAAASAAPPVSGAFTDIRSLKEQKTPKTDNEMACLVAYYLKELAPQGERKDEVTKDDIEKYFNQAGFELPKHLRMVLPGAKKAGYFDSVTAGNYRLNPVGFNLAAYQLPSNGNGGKRTGRSPGRKSGGKRLVKAKK